MLKYFILYQLNVDLITQQCRQWLCGANETFLCLFKHPSSLTLKHWLNYCVRVRGRTICLIDIWQTGGECPGSSFKTTTFQFDDTNTAEMTFQLSFLHRSLQNWSVIIYTQSTLPLKFIWALFIISPYGTFSHTIETVKKRFRVGLRNTECVVLEKMTVCSSNMTFLFCKQGSEHKLSGIAKASYWKTSGPKTAARAPMLQLSSWRDATPDRNRHKKRSKL